MEVTGAARGGQPGRPVPHKPSEITRKFPAKWSAFATAGPWSCRWVRWTESPWAPAPISRTGPPAIYPSKAWLGRVIDGFGEPMDGKGPLPQGAHRLSAARRRRRRPPRRGRIGGKLDLGVRALNAFTTCCAGQRMGIFSGSRRGQIHAAVDAGAQFQCRCHRDRPDRRARPRSEGIHRGRSGRRRPGAQRRGRRDLATKRRWCAARPPMSP